MWNEVECGLWHGLNVERCAKWNEVECGLWPHGMWNVVRHGMRKSVGCGMECGTLCDME